MTSASQEPIASKPSDKPRNVDRDSPDFNSSQRYESSRVVSEPKLVPLKCHVDDRGFLYQIFGDHNELFPKLARVYVVGNFSKGTVRGFHMHMQETKGYFVISGSAKFVVIEKGDKQNSFVLGSRNPSLLYVPPENYHGWISLDDETILVGMSDRSLEESLIDDYRTDPMKFGKEIWEIKPR